MSGAWEATYYIAECGPAACSSGVCQLPGEDWETAKPHTPKRILNTVNEFYRHSPDSWVVGRDFPSHRGATKFGRNQTSLAAKSSGCPPHRAESRCFALLATQYDYRSLCVRGDDFEWSVIGPGVSERTFVGLRYNKLLITLTGENGECVVR